MPDCKVVEAARQYSPHLAKLRQTRLRKTEQLMMKTRLWLSQKEEEQKARDFLMSLAHSEEAAQAFVEKRTP